MSRRGANLSAMWTAGRLAARRALGRTTGARDLVLGQALGQQLDQMKGLAMKLGQIVSYMDVPLPAEVQAELARLQQGVHGRPLEELHTVVERSLGAPLDACFEQIEPEPVAAASIGQVHRALLRGREVAVKIQYPEIAATFGSDLATVGRLASLASLASSVDGQAIVHELADRLTEECDYEREARAQRRFADLFADDPHVRIPEVVTGCSGAQVLTTEWVDAQPLEAFARDASQAARLALARQLIAVSYRGLLVHGLIQADPHPGNFAVAASPAGDPVLVCFDFGCVRELDGGTVSALRAMARALLDDDRSAFRDACLALGVVGNPDRFDFDHHFETMRHLHRPFLEAPFRFTPEFVREAMDYNSTSSPNARWIAMPPAYVWVARLQWGLWSVLTRLGVEGDFRDLLLACLDAPIDLQRIDTAPTPGPRDEVHA